MNKLKPLFLFGLLSFCSFSQSQKAKNYTDYVNPLMGTDSKYELSNGNVYPAVAMPWGMNFWTPQTGNMGDGWTYTYNSDRIKGFKQTHQPSPWINDYGQFSIMPITGKVVFDQDKRASWFTHKTEKVKPYYYSVYLADHDVVTEITPTERSAIFRFTFPKSDQSYIILDAFDNRSYVKIIPEQNKIIGYTTKNSGGVPDNFKNYFVLVFDKPFSYKAVVGNNEIRENKIEAKENHTGAIIGFSTTKGEKVNIRVASSFISFEQAEINLKEQGNKTFDQIKEQGKRRWNEVLGKVDVESDDIDQLRTFYSCLYRSVLFPRMFHEIDAQGQIVHYSPHNGKTLPGYMFTDTGFWDTFRSLMPFINLVYPSMGTKMQEGFFNSYVESGFYPEWSSPGHRDCMVGNNSASIVTDAYIKGIIKTDAEKMYLGLLHDANDVHPTVKSSGRMAYKEYNELGYVPYNVSQSGARTLEYAYDDWCIYQMGKKLGRPESELAIYKKRAMNYKNIFNKPFNLMSGRNADGSFQSNFVPEKWWDAFTEGSSWHYSWSVFHDINGLINLMGGTKTFTHMLDSVFAMPPTFGPGSDTHGFLVHEMREMQVINMGQYAHGNQPIQHLIYLYNYAGEPWKTQYSIRKAMDRLYNSNPDGYCGDEDNGQTSAWYVFSALGFYPVCPGSDEYVIGSPLFKKVTVNLENGKKIEIISKNNSMQACYINNLKINGKKYTKNYLNHTTLVKGAKIQLQMSEVPNYSRGVNKADYPYSLSNE